MTVYKNVERIRRAKGVTKSHIARKLGISLQGYRYIELGKTRLDAERLKVIGLTLGIKPAVFFDDKLTDCVIVSLNSDYP